MDNQLSPTMNPPAPAGRDDVFEIRAAYQALKSNGTLVSVVDAMPYAILILNQYRQIVAANREVLAMLEADPEQVLGLRPGELIGCAHCEEGPDGCGTGSHCQVCGAVRAILHAQQTHEKKTEECRITLSNGQALDWKVSVSPLIIDGQEYLLAAIVDIGDQKRRHALERIFFHDIINTIGAIVGFSRMMAEENTDNTELAEVLHLANELLDEVQAQRDLTLAERGDLELKPETVHLEAFLSRLVQLYQNHPVAGGIGLDLQAAADLEITTDARLLKRVVGNMLKNALEASAPGQTVTVTCTCMLDWVSIHVHNPSVVPQEIGLQIFHRSFSTKNGSGRGLGTYSIKLLSEKYLGGQVSFASEPGAGTTFTLKLPV